MLQSRRASGAADRGRESGRRGGGGRGKGLPKAGPALPVRAGSPTPSPQPCHPGPCGFERDRTAMNGKKKKGGGIWEQNRRLSQALGLGWGLRMGDWALVLPEGLG